MSDMPADGQLRGAAQQTDAHAADRGLETRRRLRQSLSTLSRTKGNQGFDQVGFSAEAIDALSSVLLAADSLMGECQMEDPFAPLRPVITPSGEFRWSCSHPTQHSAKG